MSLRKVELSEDEIAQLASDIVKESEFFAAWRKVIPYILRVTGAGSAAILRPVEAGHRMYVDVSYNLSQHAMEVLFNHPISIQGTLAGTSYLSRQIIIEKMSGDRYQKVAEENRIGQPVAAEGVAIVPLVGDGLIMGVLKLYYEEPPLVEKETLERLRPLFKALALALQRNDSEIAESNVRLLRQISQDRWPTPGQSPELSRVLHNIAEVTRQVLKAKSSSIFLANWRKRQAIGWAVSGMDESVVGKLMLPLDYSIAGQIIISGEPMVLTEKPEENDFFFPVGDRQFDNMCGVPLRGKRRILGALMVDDLPGPCGLETVKTLEALAQQAVMAIENTQLFTLAQYRLHNLETIQGLQKELLGTFSLPKVFEVIAGGLFKLTDAQNVQVHLYHSYDNKIELAYQTWRSGTHGDDLPIESVVWQVVETGEPVIVNSDAESLLYEDRVGRSWQTIAMAVFPLFADGYVIGTVSVTYPYASHHFDEEEQYLLRFMSNFASGSIYRTRMYQQLQEVNQLKDEAIANISHELRSPLSLMSGYLDLMAEGVLGPLTPDQESALKAMRQNADQMTALLSDIMLYSQLKAGPTLKMVPLSLVDLAQQYANNFCEKAEAKKVSIVVEQPESDVKVPGDVRWLRQAFAFLFDNALRYNQEGGTITVQFEKTEREMIVTVQDEGANVPQEAIAHIWDRFYRVRRGDENVSSTGLGLAIVKQIIELHRGRVWAQNDVGWGTRFSFALPLPGSDKAESETVSAESVSAEKATEPA